MSVFHICLCHLRSNELLSSFNKWTREIISFDTDQCSVVGANTALRSSILQVQPQHIQSWKKKKGTPSYKAKVLHIRASFRTI